MGEPQSHQGGMLAMHLAGLVAPQKSIRAGLCYLNVPSVAVAIGMRHRKLKGRALSPGMCPVWGLGKALPCLGLSFPAWQCCCLAESVKLYCTHLMGPKAPGVSVHDKQVWV